MDSQLVLFDYDQLDSETRIVVRQEDKEFDEHMGEANNNFIAACQNLKRIHEVLKYKRPGFVEYCDSKGIATKTAYKMLNVAGMFVQYTNISELDFGKSALYLLAESNTPTEAITEAIERAKAGESITHKAAKEIVGNHKASPSMPDITLIPTQMKPKQNLKGDTYNAKPYDFCQTPPYALDPLLKYALDNWLIWEPAKGEGLLERSLIERGYQVVSGDILTGQNFFDYEPDYWDALITNPPYSIKYDWLERCYQLGKPFALLMPVEMLGAKTAQELFSIHGIEIILLNRRVNFKMPNIGWSGTGAQFPVAWYTWGFDLESQLVFERLEYNG